MINMKSILLSLKTCCSGSLVSGSILFFVCLMLGYNASLTLHVLSVSILVGIPGAISLLMVLIFIHQVRINRLMTWIILMSLIPLLSLLNALHISGSLPGDVDFFFAMGILCGYTGIATHGNSIIKIINDHTYESENEFTQD